RRLARHRLRRVYGRRAGDHQGQADLPRQLDEQPAHRGPEDGCHRDRAAVRLGGAGLDRDPRRQPRQRARARAGLRDDAGAGAHQQAAADRAGAGRAGESALPLVPGGLQDVRTGDGPAHAGHRDPDRQPGQRQARHPHAAAAQRGGRAARRSQASGPGHRAPRREVAAAGVMMGDRVEPPKKPMGPSTLSVHGGEPRPKPANSLATPIVQTATFTFANTQELKDHFDGKIERVEYGRYGNPTQKIAEAKLAALEGAGDCLLFASGMAAMTTALLAMLSRGTHVIATNDAYRRTRQFLNQTLQRYGIEVSTVPAGDHDAR